MIFAPILVAVLVAAGVGFFAYGLWDHRQKCIAYRKAMDEYVSFHGKKPPGYWP